MKVVRFGHSQLQNYGDGVGDGVGVGDSDGNGDGDGDDRTKMASFVRCHQQTMLLGRKTGKQARSNFLKSV